MSVTALDLVNQHQMPLSMTGSTAHLLSQGTSCASGTAGMETHTRCGRDGEPLCRVAWIWCLNLGHWCGDINSISISASPPTKPYSTQKLLFPPAIMDTTLKHLPPFQPPPWVPLLSFTMQLLPFVCTQLQSRHTNPHLTDGEYPPFSRHYDWNLITHHSTVLGLIKKHFSSSLT